MRPELFDNADKLWLCGEQEWTVRSFLHNFLRKRVS
jgi:hypothetical protein